MTYTRYALIDFLMLVPPLLLTAYRATLAMTAKISEFNFELSVIGTLYRATRMKDKKGQQGLVKLNSTQYLRLVCTFSPLAHLHCCHSSNKKNKTERVSEQQIRQPSAINDREEESKRINESNDRYDDKALEGGSFEETLSRASLISDHLS